MPRLTPVEVEIPPYPIQNALTGPIRRAAANARPEFMSLWADQAVSMFRDLSAAKLMAALGSRDRCNLEGGRQIATKSA